MSAHDEHKSAALARALTGKTQNEGCGDVERESEPITAHLLTLHPNAECHEARLTWGNHARQGGPSHASASRAHLWGYAVRISGGTQDLMRVHLLIPEAALPTCSRLAGAVQTGTINIDQGTSRGGAHIHICAVEAHGEGVREHRLIVRPDIAALSVVRDLNGNFISRLSIMSRSKKFQCIRTNVSHGDWPNGADPRDVSGQKVDSRDAKRSTADLKANSRGKTNDAWVANVAEADAANRISNRSFSAGQVFNQVLSLRVTRRRLTPDQRRRHELYLSEGIAAESTQWTVVIGHVFADQRNHGASSDRAVRWIHRNHFWRKFK